MLAIFFLLSMVFNFKFSLRNHRRPGHAEEPFDVFLGEIPAVLVAHPHRFHLAEDVLVLLFERLEAGEVDDFDGGLDGLGQLVNLLVTGFDLVLEAGNLSLRSGEFVVPLVQDLLGGKGSVDPALGALGQFSDDGVAEEGVVPVLTEAVLVHLSGGHVDPVDNLEIVGGNLLSGPIFKFFLSHKAIVLIVFIIFAVGYLQASIRRRLYPSGDKVNDCQGNKQ